MLWWMWTSSLKRPAGTGDGQREKSVWGCVVSVAWGWMWCQAAQHRWSSQLFWCDPLDVCLLCLCAAAEPQCHAVRQHSFTARKVDQQFLRYMFSSLVSWGRAGSAGHFPMTEAVLVPQDDSSWAVISQSRCPEVYNHLLCLFDVQTMVVLRAPDRQIFHFLPISWLIVVRELCGVVCKFKDVVRWAGGSMESWGTPIWWSGLKSGACPVVLSEPIGHKVQTPGAQWGVEIYCKSLSLGISLHGRIVSKVGL